MGSLVINEVTLNETKDLIAAARKVTSGRATYFLTGPRCFDDEQLSALRACVDHDGAPAEVISDGGQKQVADVRRTQVCWLDFDRDKDVYDQMWTVANAANDIFQYDLAATLERIQIAAYEEKEQGFFQWHMDTVPSDMTRKISISVPLNDPNEYEGGVMEFMHGSSVAQVDQQAGVPVIFPSWLPHQITPVTAGKRYSLVSWVRGPNWR